MNDLLDEIALGIDQFAKRGPGRPRTKPPLIVTYLRDLTPADLVVLDNAPPAADSVTPYSSISKIRYSHHMMARLVALGKRDAEVAAITGHAINSITRLRNYDPAFKELVAHYAAIKDEQFVDASARLAVLGTTAVEELQERLEEKPAAFTVRELKEVAEMAFDRSVAPARGKGPAGGGQGNSQPVNVNVTFVSPRVPQLEDQAIIDVTPQQQLEPPK